MQKKIVWKWEHLDEHTQRVKVLGGWLVMRIGVTDVDKNKPGKIVFREGILFLSDRDHEWHPIPPHTEEKPPESKLAADFGTPEVNKAKL